MRILTLTPRLRLATFAIAIVSILYSLTGWMFAAPVSQFQPRINGTATSASSQVDFTNGATQTSDISRVGVTFHNTGSVTIYLGYGEVPTATNNEMSVPSDTTVVLQLNYYQKLYVITASSNCTYSIKEFR